MCFFSSEHKVKNGQLHQQLQTSTVNLPLIQVHHILSAVFAGRANKFEFLTLAAYLVERLNLLMAASMPQKHPEIDDVSANFKSRFVASLGEVAKFVTEEKKKLLDREDVEESDRKEENEDEEEEEAEAEMLGIRGKGSASGRYFRKCSNVLRAQVEVRRLVAFSTIRNHIMKLSNPYLFDSWMDRISNKIWTESGGSCLSCTGRSQPSAVLQTSLRSQGIF